MFYGDFLSTNNSILHSLAFKFLVGHTTDSLYQSQHLCLNLLVFVLNMHNKLELRNICFKNVKKQFITAIQYIVFVSSATTY